MKLFFLLLLMSFVPFSVVAQSCGWQILFRYPCSCETNSLNCSDFSSQFAAQHTFECCFSKVGLDIHQLDGDRDNKACEGLSSYQ